MVFCLSVSFLKIRQTKLELRNDCHFRTNKCFTDSTVFTKKCQMLQCNVVMKVTNEKKRVFSFSLHNMKKILMRAISIRIDLMFQLKVLIINKSKVKKIKVKIINISNCTRHIVKFFIGFDTLLLANFCRFSERDCRFIH